MTDERRTGKPDRREDDLLARPPKDPLEAIWRACLLVARNLGRSGVDRRKVSQGLGDALIARAGGARQQAEEEKEKARAEYDAWARQHSDDKTI